MDNAQAPAPILDTLRTVEFRLGLKGYNVDEVDEYLDKAAQEAEALQEHVRQLNERLRQASERIAQLEREKKAAPPAPAPVAAEPDQAAAAVAAADAATLSDETLQRTLLLAQKFVDQTKRESEAEAAAVIAQAEETARAAIAAGRGLRSPAADRGASEAARGGDPARGHADRAGRRRREHGPPPRGRAQPPARRADRDPASWVDDNVQPANSLMGVKPKAALSGPGRLGRRGRPQSGRPAAPAPVDEGPPTLNLQSASASGLPRSV